MNLTDRLPDAFCGALPTDIIEQESKLDRLYSPRIANVWRRMEPIKQRRLTSMTHAVLKKLTSRALVIEPKQICRIGHQNLP